MARYMLTTTDNPFDPLTQWDAWYNWDEQAGYQTCGLLARLIIDADELSDADQHDEHDRAIDLILDINPTGNYKKIPIPENFDKDS